MTIFATQAELAEATEDATGGAWPVGSVFLAVVSTNPATLLGFGTWSAFGAGRMLVGRDGSDADFDTAEETGGAKTHSHAVGTIAPNAHSGTAVASHSSHTHTYSEVLNHTHAVSITDPGHVHAQRVINQTTAGTAGVQGEDTASNSNSANTASNTTGITATTSNPAGGVATGTTAGPSATLSHSVTQPSDHTMSGNTAAANGLPPYIVVYMWKRTA